MNANEPVAWMIKTLDGKMLMLYGQEQPPKFESKVQYIPLYTHPAKALTDEIEALKEPKIPLLEQEIKFILGNGQCWQGEDCSMPNLMYIIRAVEAAHGIGVKQNEQ